MDTVTTILSRRSWRHGFNSRQPDLQALRTIVDCGLAAPSSKNAQPWRFHVVTERAKRLQIASAMVKDPRIARYVPMDPATGRALPDYDSSVHESAKTLSEAPVAIFVENLSQFSGGRARLVAHPKTLTEAIIGYGFELVGIGAAIENILLASRALGLGAVFMGDVLIAEATIRSLLRTAGDIVGVISLGYVDEDHDRPSRVLHSDRVVFHAQ